MSEEKRASLAVPVLIGLLALAGFQGFQTVELLSARSSLNAALVEQQGPIATGQSVRRQINLLAAQTAELAQKGDADAKAIADQFAKQGFTLVPRKNPAQ
jgi:hypothetical protein